jgi:ribonucleoside-diphosphate reductase alpha subunit
MCYKDQVNYKSNQKNIGIIKSSNLCVEVNLFSDSKETAVCNLASICLSKFVENRINNFIVYSKDNCKYCDLAKKLLSGNNLEYSEILMNNETERLDFYEKYTDEEEGMLVNTMPQIFNNNERIGGYTDLVKYLQDNKYSNFEKLGEVTETIVENLDIVIDKNYYPTNEAKTSNMKHRPIGIGVQGLADAFMLMNLSFTCDSAKKLNKDIFETIYYYALKKSCQLAKEKGTYETFSGSPASKGILQFDMWNKTPEKIPNEKWNFLKQEIQEYGLRNSTLIALMPTASTAQIMGNNESFEPYTSNMYTRRVLAGEFVLINKHLIKYLKNNNLFSKETVDSIILQKGSVQGLNISKKAKEIFKTVWEISQKSLLEMSADRSPYICQSQSFNVFIEKADPKIINSVHLYGHSLGLKTGSYYIRTKPALSTQNFSMDYLKETKHNLERNKNQADLHETRESYEPCLSCSG